MGKNFIGPEELLKLQKHFSLFIPKNIIQIPFEKNKLLKLRKDYLLILGTSKDKKGKPLTLNRIRQIFGVNPKKSEPCFYNQDWYLKEKFASQKTLDAKWYLLKKNIIENTRMKNPNDIQKKMKSKERFPSAVLCTFTFFAYYFLNKKELLWKYDFIWCRDKDVNGDRVYVGRYADPKKINKNGFNVHRHLSIRTCYGFVPEVL